MTRLLEGQLRQSQKMDAIGQLAGGVAHDFNNVLTAIMGYAELLLAEPALTEDQREDVSQIRAAGERAASLTQQLLAFSRHQVRQPRVVRISEVVTNLLPMLRRILGEHIEIAASEDERDPPVFGDVTQLEQIVLNLAINAGDAMAGGGVLTLRTGHADLDEAFAGSHFDVVPGTYSTLEVIDTGAGMDETTRARIFEPFFTTKPLGRGTGLGLSTVYGIVKQMRGTIWVYSEPGAGSTFRLYFPRHVEAAATAGEGTGTPQQVAGGHETVLVVEDEAPVRAFVARVLEHYGYQVLSTANPAEALRTAGQNAHISIVVTDIRMPGGTGPDLVAALRRRDPALRALFMSGYSDIAVLAANGDPDDRHFLAKPFSAADLAAKVRGALDEPA